jgi:hypothetical protein
VVAASKFKYPVLTCVRCGETYGANRSDSKYCSGSCRAFASTERKIAVSAIAYPVQNATADELWRYLIKQNQFIEALQETIDNYQTIIRLQMEIMAVVCRGS